MRRELASSYANSFLGFYKLDIPTSKVPHGINVPGISFSRPALPILGPCTEHKVVPQCIPLRPTACDYFLRRNRHLPSTGRIEVSGEGVRW